MYRILIVEDDETIAKATKECLTQWGYEVLQVTDFQKVMEEFVAFDPQLVILDIMLPFFNGYHWCSQIRAISQIPILFLSSMSDNMNIVMAMNMGGDDFIAKPFDVPVFVAKIQALLRRTYSFQGQAPVIEHKGVILNLNTAEFLYQDQKVDLTKNEYKILQLLMEKRGSVVSRNELIQWLWDDDSFIDDNTLTVNVTRMRKKLEEVGLLGFISTKKGIGYMV